VDVVPVVFIVLPATIDWRSYSQRDALDIVGGHTQRQLPITFFLTEQTRVQAILHLLVQIISLFYGLFIIVELLQNRALFFLQLRRVVLHQVLVTPVGIEYELFDSAGARRIRLISQLVRQLALLSHQWSCLGHDFGQTLQRATFLKRFRFVFENLQAHLLA